MSDTYESDSYEVVLYETKDKLQKFVQVWYKGYNEPLYRRYTITPCKFLWINLDELDWRTYFNDTALFKIEMDIAMRKDTEKFPDLDKITAYNKENGITPYNDSN